MNFYRVATGERCHIDPAAHAAWVAAGNPKAAAFLPEPPKPAYDPDTHTCEWNGSGWTVAAKPAPEAVVWRDAGAFFASFTAEEKAAIDLCTDPTIAALRATLYTYQGRVLSNDDGIQTGMARLVTLGILTHARAAAIVTPPGLITP